MLTRWSLQYQSNAFKANALCHIPSPNFGKDWSVHEAKTSSLLKHLHCLHVEKLSTSTSSMRLWDNCESWSFSSYVPIKMSPMYLRRMCTSFSYFPALRKCSKLFLLKTRASSQTGHIHWWNKHSFWQHILTTHAIPGTGLSRNNMKESRNTHGTESSEVISNHRFIALTLLRRPLGPPPGGLGRPGSTNASKFALSNSPSAATTMSAVTWLSTSVHSHPPHVQTVFTLVTAAYL